MFLVWLRNNRWIKNSTRIRPLNRLNRVVNKKHTNTLKRITAIQNLLVNLTCDNGVVELVQFVLQGVDEPTHRQQPDDEHRQHEEHAHRPRLYVTFFECRLVPVSVPAAESRGIKKQWQHTEQTSNGVLASRPGRPYFLNLFFLGDVRINGGTYADELLSESDMPKSS